jgi:hypothetical protein
MPPINKKTSTPKASVRNNPKRYNELLIDTSDKKLMDQLSAKFKNIHLNSNTSCTAGSLNCLTDFVQPILQSPSVRSMTQQNTQKYKVPSKEMLDFGNKYVPNNSIDAWEIHNQLSGENLGTNLINPNSKLTYKKNKKGEIIHQVPTGFDYKNLPIGTILGQGNSSGVYTDPKQGTKSRHAMTIIGYDKKDGEPLVYDYGKVRRLSDNTGVDGSMPINNVTIPKGYEKYNKNYIESEYNNYTTKLGYNKDVPVNYGSSKPYIGAIQKGVNTVKTQIGKDYSLSQDEMNALAYKLPGIANQESGINNNERITKSKFLDNAVGNYVVKPYIKMYQNAFNWAGNLFKDEGNKKKLYQIELDAYKRFPNDPSKRGAYQAYLKRKNDSIESSNYQQLSPSVGPFSIKNVPQYSKDKLGLTKGSMYGVKYNNQQELENGSKVALNILAENYSRLKNQYPKLTKDELANLTVTSYNNSSKQKDAEYVDYYIKNRKLKDNYVDKVNAFKTKDNVYADGGYMNNGINPKFNDYLNVNQYASGGWLDKYDDSNQFAKGGEIDPPVTNLHSAEKYINKSLGYPMARAEKAGEAIGEKWLNPKTGKWEVEGRDNFRHPMAGRYTSEAIQSKFPDWMQYTGVPQIAGTLGATGLGVGHELTTLLSSEDKRSFMDKLREAGEDSYNNFVGAAVGSMPVNAKTKTKTLEKLSNRNMLPDGLVYGNKDFYMKHAEGGYLNKNDGKKINIKESPRQITSESTGVGQSLKLKGEKAAKNILNEIKKGNNIVKHRGDYVITANNKILIPVNREGQQEQYVPYKQLKPNQKLNQKEINKIDTYKDALDKENLGFLQRPLTYLDSPEKILGDINIPGMETSEDDRLYFAQRNNNPNNANMTLGNKMVDSFKYGAKKIPGAALNLGLAALGNPTANALRVTAEAMNPIPMPLPKRGMKIRPGENTERFFKQVDNADDTFDLIESKDNPFQYKRNIIQSPLVDIPLQKELIPYLSRYSKPISREEEIIRMSMGPEYRAKKELEDMVHLDPDGNVVSSPLNEYKPFVEDDYIKSFNNKNKRNINAPLIDPFIPKSSSIIELKKEGGYLNQKQSSTNSWLNKYE